MHSGDDLFVEGGSTASGIAAAGQRRTRRNRIAGGALAGFAALSVVFGATQLTGADDPTDIAIDELVTTDDISSSDEAASSGLSDGAATDSQLFDGPIAPFDVITGSFDGFVGIRTTGDVLTVIRSADGITWEETATDLPEGLSVTSIATNGPKLAATFSSFESTSTRNFIGTTVDLSTWELTEVDLGSGNLTDIAVTRDDVAVPGSTVIATGSSLPELTEESSEVLEVSAVVVIMEPNGPAEVIELGDVGTAFNVASMEGGFVASVFDDGAGLLLSPDGRDWSVINLPLRGDFVTPSHAGDDFIAVVQNRATIAIFRSSNLGETWESEELPASLVGEQWWSADVQSNEQTTAVLLTGELGSALLVSNGPELTEVDLAPFVPADSPAILRGVSNDEVILEVFAAPTQDAADLAAASGIVDEDVAVNQPQAPTYVRVPIPAS